MPSSMPTRTHIRTHACTPHARRDFLLANYAEMKKANPYFPILVRESAGAEAKLIARYGGWCVAHRHTACSPAQAPAGAAAEVAPCGGPPSFAGCAHDTPARTWHAGHLPPTRRPGRGEVGVSAGRQPRRHHLKVGAAAEEQAVTDGRERAKAAGEWGRNAAAGVAAAQGNGP